MKMGVEIGVEQIEAGDTFHEDGRTAWVARTDAAVVDDMVTVEIMFPDGGRTVRGWDVGARIKIARELD